MPSEKNTPVGKDHPHQDFEVIKPAKFEHSNDNGKEFEKHYHKPARTAKSKTPLILAVLGLSVCLLFVIVWLPRLINNEQTPSTASTNPATPSSSTKTPSATATPATTAAPEESPFTAAQLAKQRKEAQAALEKLLEQQQELEALSVQDWAATEFQQAFELATLGDSSYSKRQFLEATENYNKANDILSSTLDNKAEFITKVVAQGEQALKLGQKKSAIEAFSLALKIAPDNVSASNGLKRAETIEQVFPLFAQATNQAEEDQFDEAIATYSEILKIDPLASDASNAISALKAKRNEQQFGRHMSRGLAAIDAGNAASAREYFNKAAKLKPNDKGVKDGLRQASRMHSNARINNYLSNVSTYESQEDWGKVIETLDTAIAKEGELSGFTDRRNAAASRLQLDQRLQKMISEPELLSDDNTYKAAEKIVAQARATTPAGAKLLGQIAAAENLLRTALIPLEITIESDNLTDINVYKVARLGKISREALTLKPGKYVITGARNGYRDVRQEIILTASDNGKSFRVVCTQPI